MRALCEGALAVAREVVRANAGLHEALSRDLEAPEKLEGAVLQVRTLLLLAILLRLGGVRVVGTTRVRPLRHVGLEERGPQAVGSHPWQPPVPLAR